MATVSDYLQNSLRLTGILGENDTVSAEQGSAGLVTFNDMVGALRGDGIELGIPPQSSTTATLLMPEEDRLGFKNLLGVYLCMSYGGRTAPDDVKRVAQSFYDKCLRRAVLADTMTNNAIMPLGQGRGYGYNIDTDR